MATLDEITQTLHTTSCFEVVPIYTMIHRDSTPPPTIREGRVQLLRENMPEAEESHDHRETIKGIVFLALLNLKTKDSHGYSKEIEILSGEA